ncbi:hypothetical protein [Alloacidobacterium sp.]|uniref:hypothetical protein n=1 Tax=Alloacidobacterium sp. TaxID=2951999 RepID=UPI002D448F23|nr:hypothetical protein [Alloacidobacterium sp.]HYK37319.1 hypothetical protein [Alloacidobacterium sp.]
MPYRRSLTLSVLFLSCLSAVAKDKKKVALPIDILQAHTAWVIIDPHAGMDVTDPNANRQARADVEAALAKWGRINPVTDPAMADLIIVVRKGSGKLVQPTIGNAPGNAPPPVIAQRTDSGINIAARQGPPPEASDPHPQMEVGSTQDTFVVYRGNLASSNTGILNPLDSPPAWRYTAKNALASPGVPAVDAFRKAIADSEKALAGP